MVTFAIRILALDQASLWIDEVYTDMWMQAPADQFFSLILQVGNHMPLHFAILRIFPLGGETLLRLPSVLEGLVSVALMMGVVLRLYKRYDLALWSGILIAVNPYHVWYSRAARPYILLFIMSLVVSYYFLRLLSGDRSQSNWIAFMLSSTAAYLTHYFAVMLPLAQYIVFAFVLRKQRRMFRRWVVVQALAVVPVLIWFYALSQQEGVAINISWIPRPVLSDLFLTIWNMALDYEGTIFWYTILGLLPVLGGLIPGLYYAVRERKTNLVNFYWFWLLTAPLVLIFVFSLFSRPLYVDRYFMVFLPSMILLILYGWWLLPRRVGQAALGLVVFVNLVTIAHTLERSTIEREAWRDVARYVEPQFQEGDGFLFEEQISLVAFLTYYDNRTMLDRTLLFDVPDAGANGAPATDTWAGPVERLWAIYRNPNDDVHREGVMPDFDPFESKSDVMMSEWLQNHHEQIIEQHEFNGIKVFLVDVSADDYGDQ